MHSLRVIVFILFSLPVYTHAGAPTGFRDIPWGASVTDIMRAFPLVVCNRIKPIEQAFPDSDWNCIAKTTIAEVDVTVGFFFYEVQDKRVNGFMGYLLRFPPEGFDAIKGAFMDLYGLPYERKGDQWWWIWWKDAFISLERVDAEGEGWAVVRRVTPSIQAERTKRIASMRKGAGDGL